MQEYEYHNKIMGCDLNISIITDKGDPQKYFDICFKELQDYESIFSRFDEKSELSLLNNKKNMYVSDIFFEVFLEAKNIFYITDGVFNPLVQLAEFGYNRDFSFKRDFKKKKLINYDDDFSKIIFDEEKKYIQLGVRQKLDFGGFLKGYCAEKVSEKLSHFYGSIVNIGGDIYAQGMDEKQKDFSFTIYHPLKKDYIFPLTLQKQCLSTSGTYKRKWLSGDKDISHIIHSKKRVSVKSDLISASIISDNGAQSDAYATLSIVLGSEKMKKYLSGKQEIYYLFITNEGKIIHNIDKHKKHL